MPRENARSWSWNLRFDPKVKLVFSHNLSLWQRQGISTFQVKDEYLSYFSKVIRRKAPKGRSIQVNLEVYKACYITQSTHVHYNLIWCLTPVIPALGKLRQEDKHESETSVNYRMRLCITKGHK